ncbi:hypothetical protein COLSTE_01267 [Collinsella stercoris DSM 13279]|uniref:Uncharacterized protein n=1 Tax=Collinsella stercoris DSM 13279 TaxID=445975 RepID=B6GB14_9ACTN|nr:hypothetical protein COLSTE_01267 [Collinsella stercoris DSM 13279]
MLCSLRSYRSTCTSREYHPSCSVYYLCGPCDRVRPAFLMRGT